MQSWSHGRFGSRLERDHLGAESCIRGSSMSLIQLAPSWYAAILCALPQSRISTYSPPRIHNLSTWVATSVILLLATLFQVSPSQTLIPLSTLSVSSVYSQRSHVSSCFMCYWPSQLIITNGNVLLLSGLLALNVLHLLSHDLWSAGTIPPGPLSGRHITIIPCYREGNCEPNSPAVHSVLLLQSPEEQ